MGKVKVNATISLDGYVARPDGTGSEHLFAWFAGGDLEFPSVNPGVGPSIRLTEPDHRYSHSSAGATFAFTWKTLSGSHSRFRRARRSTFASP